MKREFIKGRPVLVVIDIQAETFGDITVEAIPAMAGYADRMSSTRCS